jgi:hypothetical protein
MLALLIDLDDQLRADYVMLQNQCAQLDMANRAWQLFYDNQMELLRTKFQNSLLFDQNDNFEQIIETIAQKLDRQRQTEENLSSGIDIAKRSL